MMHALLGPHEAPIGNAEAKNSRRWRNNRMLARDH
jgi:hypothetical protein